MRVGRIIDAWRRFIERYFQKEERPKDEIISRGIAVIEILVFKVWSRERMEIRRLRSLNLISKNEFDEMISEMDNLYRDMINGLKEFKKLLIKEMGW